MAGSRLPFDAFKSSRTDRGVMSLRIDSSRPSVPELSPPEPNRHFDLLDVTEKWRIDDGNDINPDRSVTFKPGKPRLPIVFHVATDAERARARGPDAVELLVSFFLLASLRALTRS